MLANIIENIKSKLSPAALLTTAKEGVISLYQAILKAGPIAIVAFIVSYFFAWWGILVVLFFYAAFQKELSAKSAFGIGMTTGILLWSVYSIYLDTANEGFLATKIGSMFAKGIPNTITSTHLIEITAFIGGLLGAMGATTGVFARELIYDTRLKFGWKW
jgi:hypothetical protein